MRPKQKLALGILWLGCAVAVALGFFGGSHSFPPAIYIPILLTALVMTFVIASDSTKN